MNEENIKSEDYISLPGFKKISILILEFIFAISRQIVYTIKNNKLLLATGLVTGLIVGYSYYSSRPVYYEVTMIAESKQLQNNTVSEMIKQLDILLKTQSYQKFGSEVGLTETEARQMLGIRAISLTDDGLENDTSTKIHQPIKIVANIKNSSLADKFQSGVIDYMNNKPSLKKIKEDQVKIYEGKLQFIDNELARLDTLKIEYNHFLASSKISATFYNNAFDPANIYLQSNNIMAEKVLIQSWLSTDSKPIVAIDDFKGTMIPQSVSIVKSLLTGALIGFLVCFLLGLFIDLNQKIKKYVAR
jgi:hypothetical protein